MNYDPIEFWRGQRRRRAFDVLIACLLVMAGSMVIYLREFGYENADLFIHATIASEFDFTDLHSITCRLSYPMWHLIVSALYQLGMPLGLAAAGVCALCKGLSFCLAYALVGAMAGEKADRRVVLGLSLFLMIVTGVLIPSVTDAVYRGVGSPTVWHNPTQQIVTAAMLMVMPWLAHCWYAFERRAERGERDIVLPWRDIVVLAVLCMGSVACKPTFMQALLPAAFVMFLAELIRRPAEWRYFGQIVLAFVPSVGYFLLSYLYYTGVVVEFTSGVDIGITAESAWVAVRNTLMMSACPLAAVIACWRKGLFKNRLLVLALLMTLFSVLEAMAFRETGMRAGHGNFTWAANSSSFFLWVIMTGVCLRCVQSDIQTGSLTLKRKLGYAAVTALFLWHVFSAVYYLWYLLTTTNAF
ncbi:MAG: hypothetical protein MRZ54_04185 [Clostridiales bacterium]|nr:hypothetical protein [Clostridiales bacterium]